jgi:hypothetical protein
MPFVSYSEPVAGSGQEIAGFFFAELRVSTKWGGMMNSEFPNAE